MTTNDYGNLPPGDPMNRGNMTPRRSGGSWAWLWLVIIIIILAIWWAGWGWGNSGGYWRTRPMNTANPAMQNGATGLQNGGTTMQNTTAAPMPASTRP